MNIIHLGLNGSSYSRNSYQNVAAS